MQKTAKSAIMWVVGLLVLFAILAETIPSIMGAAGNISAIAYMPTIIGTVADFWWIGVLILLIGVVMSTSAGKGAINRFRRSRRRR